jgi:acetyl-CoA carboxylase carboxyltransferase component
MTDFAELRERIERGGAARYHEAAAARGKLFARERIAALVNEGSFTEDGRYANALADGLPADGVVTGTATIGGRPVALMANDSTVKAGSWGARTVEKIIRIIEKAYDVGIPMIYLVDSAGARITDQVDMFPGRRGAGRIFRTQIRASGSIPQVCALAVGGRRRVHPGVLRLHRHGGRQRLDVPGQPPDGRDGGQREDHAGGNGRRPAALHGIRQRAFPGRDGAGRA